MPCDSMKGAVTGLFGLYPSCREVKPSCVRNVRVCTIFFFVNDYMELIGPPLVQIFHSFYETQRFITAFTRVHHLSPILNQIKTVLGPTPTPKSDFWNEKVRGNRDGGRERYGSARSSTIGVSLELFRIL
jgi:hypothetical protein